jgi:hypothetical protein
MKTWRKVRPAELPTLFSVLLVGKNYGGVGQNENIVATDTKLVGWGNGIRSGRGTNATCCSKAAH